MFSGLAVPLPTQLGLDRSVGLSVLSRGLPIYFSGCASLVQGWGQCAISEPQAQAVR